MPEEALKLKANAARRARQSSPQEDAKVVQFAIRLPSHTARALEERKQSVEAVIERLGDSVEASRGSGRTTSFLVTIDPEGRPAVRPLGDMSGQKSGSQADDADLESALTAARERGRLKVAEILSAEDMLSGDQLAGILGMSRMTVNARRKRHELLALEGAKRGFRFPAWQIDRQGKPFAVLPKLFAAFGGSAWSVYRFLLQHHAELGGLTARDALMLGRDADVVGAAEGQSMGTFG